MAGLAAVDGHALVVNADLPCATPEALVRLAAAGLALVEAADGTTNALSLPDPDAFRPLFGAGSAARFRAHLPYATVAIPELEVDVDTESDLVSVAGLVGPRTRALLASSRVRVVALSGGGGGARFARGLADVLEPGELTVIGNVGDDVEILGVHVSPDLDSLLYLFAGLLDEERGWGRADETWNALGAAAAWGGEDWFRLGDLDLGLHLVRMQALRQGAALSRVTAELVERAGVTSRIVPATDDTLRTHVLTAAGRFEFQEWYVGRGHRDEVDGVEYEGADAARAAPGVVDALAAADAILLGPSNPYLSVGPIVAVPEIREAIESRRVRCVAVSPLVGGAAVSGPLDRMLSRMAGGTTPEHVARSLDGLIDVLVIDEADGPAEASVELVVTSTLMRDRDSARRLAETVLEAACA